MKIEYHPPAARGVATLMYVGDDAINGGLAGLTPGELGAGLVGIALAAFGTGLLRWVGAYVAVDIALRSASRR
jgi:hypothetical protein